MGGIEAIQRAIVHGQMRGVPPELDRPGGRLPVGVPCEFFRRQIKGPSPRDNGVPLAGYVHYAPGLAIGRKTVLLRETSIFG